MAGGKERVLRRRIGSVQNTKKITRAMELIAATRVVKAQQRARAAKPYAEQITSVNENLAARGAEVLAEAGAKTPARRGHRARAAGQAAAPRRPRGYPPARSSTR